MGRIPGHDSVKRRPDEKKVRNLTHLLTVHIATMCFGHDCADVFEERPIQSLRFQGAHETFLL